MAQLPTQWRHRVEIDQQSGSPRIADTLQFAPQKVMIRSVYVINARVELLSRQEPAPDLTKARQAARNQTKAAASAAIGAAHPLAGMCPRRRTPAARPLDHLPVDIVVRPVQIEHRARRVGKQHSGSR